MPKRDWISREHCLFRTSNGKVYARPNIPGMGRREFPIGKTLLGDASEKDIKALARLKEKKIAEMLRKSTPVRPEFALVETVALEVVESKRKKAFKTFESADLHINNHLLPWIRVHAPYFYEWEERGETLWQAYIDEKRRAKPDMKFLNHRKHLRMILLRAFERGTIKRRVKLYDPDPATDVGKVLSNDDVKALYENASASLKVQIMMAFTMGFRKSEILRLEWKRVDFDKSEIILLRNNTKTRKPRVVPMNKWVHTVLAARHRKRVGPYVFWSRYNRLEYQASNKTSWASAKREAGVTARFHDLRHTFITNAVRKGMNPILISKYAGVSQDVMANVYCHLDTNDLKQIADHMGESMGVDLK